MTDQQQIQNLQFKFDQLQNRHQQLAARVDEIVKTMNEFVVEVRTNVCTLLDAKITDPQENNTHAVR